MRVQGHKEVSNSRSLTQERSDIFHRDMQDIIDHVPEVSWSGRDVEWLWADIKVSISWHEIPKIITANPEDMKYVTDDIVRKSYKKACEQYPLEISCRLLQWYSYFDNLGVHQLAMPSKRDYDYFFRLKAKGDISQLARPRNVMFHRFIHRLFSKQAAGYRIELLREILWNPKNIWELNQKTYVLPIDYQFFLTTHKVYKEFSRDWKRYRDILFEAIDDGSFSLPKPE